jgi:hypothetical protein
MLSARRNIADTSRIVGNVLNSSGRSMNNTVISISTEKVIDTQSSKSRSIVGTGISKTTSMPTIPMANIISVCFITFWKNPKGAKGELSVADFSAIDSQIQKLLYNNSLPGKVNFYMYSLIVFYNTTYSE